MLQQRAGPKSTTPWRNLLVAPKPLGYFERAEGTLTSAQPPSRPFLVPCRLHIFLPRSDPSEQSVAEGPGKRRRSWWCGSRSSLLPAGRRLNRYLIHNLTQLSPVQLAFSAVDVSNVYHSCISLSTSTCRTGPMYPITWTKLAKIVSPLDLIDL